MITKFKIFEETDLNNIPILKIGDYVQLKINYTFPTIANFINSTIGKITNIDYFSIKNDLGEKIPNYITVCFEFYDINKISNYRYHFDDYTYDINKNIYLLFSNFSATDVEYYGTKEDVMIMKKSGKYNL